MNTGKSNTNTQLSLNHLDIKEDASFDDFDTVGFLPVIHASRELIHGKIRELYLFGDTGSGKSHLLFAIHKAYIQTGRSAIFLSLKALLDADVEMLTGLEMFSLIILDDIHLIQQQPDWQAAIFHLINRVRTQQHQLLYTANVPVRGLELELHDLTTRLSQALSFALPDGDDINDRLTLINSILRKRNWRLPETVIDLLASEGPRHVGDTIHVIETIAPLLNGRKYTGKLSKKTLENIKHAIRQESFLVELADVDFDDDNKIGEDNPDDPNLPLPI